MARGDARHPRIGARLTRRGQNRRLSPLVPSGHQSRVETRYVPGVAEGLGELVGTASGLELASGLGVPSGLGVVSGVGVTSGLGVVSGVRVVSGVGVV